MILHVDRGKLSEAIFSVSQEVLSLHFSKVSVAKITMYTCSTDIVNDSLETKAHWNEYGHFVLFSKHSGNHNHSVVQLSQSDNTNTLLSQLCSSNHINSNWWAIG